MNPILELELTIYGFIIYFGGLFIYDHLKFKKMKGQ